MESQIALFEELQWGMCGQKRKASFLVVASPFMAHLGAYCRPLAPLEGSGGPGASHI